MKTPSIIIIAWLLMLTGSACSGSRHEKKIIVMASGRLTITGNTIQLEPSLRHNEQELILTEEKPVITVQTTGGSNKTFSPSEDGVYVLNLQTDTLIGGIVKYGTGGRPGSISSDELEHIIDSTRQLMQGQNASDAKGSYFIVPFSLKKLSDKSNTRIIGSFKNIPYSNESDASGNIPDVIKLFTNKQKREALQDLEAEKIRKK